MFHIHAADTEIIKIIHDRYISANNNNQLDKFTQSLPLLSLAPDKEFHNAFFYCIENENIKSFEYLIKMVIDFPGICLTSQMMKYVPLMLTIQSPTFLQFFDEISYRPLVQQEVLVIDIQDELPEEIDFPSNTSFITKNVVLEKLEEMGYLKPRKDKSKLT